MKTIVMAAVATLGFAVTASAVPISIDDFSTAQGPIFDPMLVPGQSNTDTQAAPGGAIADRTLTVTSASGAFTSGRINFLGSGQLEVSNDNGAQGTVSVSYDLAGLDLTGGGILDTIVVGVNMVDLSGLFTVDVDGVTANAAVGSTGNLNFAFSAFAGANFSSVNTLSFSVDSNGVDSLDSSFTFIGVEDLEPNPGVPAVPLPAGGVLLLSGLVGLAAVRRRKS